MWLSNLSKTLLNAQSYDDTSGKRFKIKPQYIFIIYLNMKI